MNTERSVSRRGFLRATAGASGVVGATGTATAAENGSGGKKPDFGGYIDGAKGGTFKDMRGQKEVTVKVGGGSSGLAFLPTGLWIDPGTTITFKWVSNGHNVVPESQPDGANWNGHTPLENTGFTYTHTFDTTGIYKYYCRPHKPLGMLGAIAVGDDVPTISTGGGGGGGGGGGPSLPDSAKTLGVATFTAMLATLGLGYFFLKYGGGTPDSPE